MNAKNASTKCIWNISPNSSVTNAHVNWGKPNDGTHKVLEAKFVSSCLSWPSRASPRLSLLLLRSGERRKTLDKLNPGPTGHPSQEPHYLQINISH